MLKTHTEVNQRTCKDRNTTSPMSSEHGRGPWCIQTLVATANLAPHQIIPKSPSYLLYWPRFSYYSKSHCPWNYRDYSEESLLTNMSICIRIYLLTTSCCKINILKTNEHCYVTLNNKFNKVPLFFVFFFFIQMDKKMTKTEHREKKDTDSSLRTFFWIGIWQLLISYRDTSAR